MTIYSNGDDPGVILNHKSNSGSEWFVTGEYTPYLKIIHSPDSSLNSSAKDAITSTLELIDTYMQTKGMGVSLSDLGIAY